MMLLLQHTLLLLTLVLGVSRTSAIHAQDLGGSDWQLSNSNSSIRIAASVPGYVRQALQQAGLIGDPLFGQNEEQQHWISLDTWTFTRQFQVSSAQLHAAAVDLLLDGLDTLADVYCNGQLVLEARNFHRQYQIPVKHVLKEGTNSLSITFNSSVRAAYQAADAYPYEVPSNPSPRAYLFYNFVRKPASDFGWDWGPAIAPVGIYGNITLLSYDVPYIAGVHVQQSAAAEKFNVAVEVTVRVPANMAQHMTLMATLAGIAAKQEISNWTEGLQRVHLQLNVPKEAVRLWWPRGLGAQPLYPLTAALAEPNTSCSGSPGGSSSTRFSIRGVMLDSNTGCSSCTLQLGFRQVELVTEPLDQAWSHIHPNATPLHLTPPSTGPLPPPNSTHDIGESFYFRVNGKPVYIQGANLIPLDVLHTRAGPESVRALLRQAARAGMNMIRVWGGGRYQIDELYEWCDQHGIMVWQELMYACAPYPRDIQLMQEGALEAEEQLRRLAYHPSIAIWGGNNEVEALFPEYAVVQQNLGLYVSDFNAWFTDTLRSVVEQLDPARPYLDTSPTNGLYSRQPYIKRWGNPQNPRFGDVHFYNYTGDCMRPLHYPPAKFVSEHGFQSMPSWQAISRVTQPSDWQTFSSAIEYRQRHPWGQEELLNQLAMHFNLPQEWQQRTTAAQHTVTDLVAIQANGPTPHAPLRGNASAYMLPPVADTPEQQVIQPGVLRNASGSTVKRRARLMQPKSGSGTSTTQVGLLKTWIYLTQVQQALCLSTAAQQWRRLSLDPAALTMGLLYWQLNDIWAGYSWSGLDAPDAPGVSPHWKPLHYAMARAFGPISTIANANDGDGQTKVMLVSNVGLPITANITFRLVPLWAELDQCGAYWQETIQSVTVPPQGMQHVWTTSTQALLSNMPGCTIQTCYLAISVEYAPQAQCCGQAEDNRRDSNPTRSNDSSGQVRDIRQDNLSAEGDGASTGSSSGSMDDFTSVLNGSACEIDWWQNLVGDIAGISFPLPSNTNANQGSQLNEAAQGMLSSDGQQLLNDSSGTQGAKLLHASQLFFEYPKDLQLSVPCNASQVVMEDWVVEADQRVCFTLSTPCVLPYFVLGLDTPATLSLPGYFSDNLFALDPCQARRLCFTYDGSKGQSLDDFELLQAVKTYIAPWDLQSAPL